ncbi:AEC family transporter [Brevibacillus migulae]|uniref:AEC family transporter n=1 Tax=Brevibacillus migulae TaxID=1644114 RepID=UPI00106EABC4
MAPVLSSILVMGVIVGIGAIIGKKLPLTADSRKLMIMLIVNVAMPCIILDGIFQLPIDRTLLTQIFVIFAIAVLFTCMGILLGWIGAKACKVPDKEARQLAILAGCGNTGFIGLPLCAALFGAKGALLAAVFDAGLDFTIWTVGVMLLQEKRKLTLGGLKELVNIPMFAIAGGLFVAVLGLEPPDIVKQLTGSLAKLASPLAMMYIGMLIPVLLHNKKRVPLPMLGLPLAMKLIVFPLVTAGLLFFFSIDQELAHVTLIQTAMPTIAMASILFARYAADEEMGAMTTVFSTLLGLLTIPAVIAMGNLILQHSP